MSICKLTWRYIIIKLMPPLPFDLVFARSLNYGIGFQNSIPWKLPADLKMFKKITCSGPHMNSIIMGRKTF